MTLGFTFSYGALFAKTWQMYCVHTNAKLKKKVTTTLKLILLCKHSIAVSVKLLILLGVSDVELLTNHGLLCCH